MKYKSTIEKADNISAVLMTGNGFPVYDIMVPTRTGYCSASGIAFYTEDEEVLAMFGKLHTPERKEFLINNPQYVKSVQSIFKDSPEMSHPLPLAYNHLISAFEKTVQDAYYGCTHLIEGDKLLIFHQSEVFHKTNYKINKNSEFNDLYDDLQNMLVKAYKEGKVKPDGIITGKAVERLKAKNPDIFKQIGVYQAKTLDILKSFKNELLDQCKLTYNKDDNLTVNIEIQNRNYVVTVADTKKAKLKLTIDNDTKEFKDIHDVIVEVYKEVNNHKLNSFIKFMKM